MLSKDRYVQFDKSPYLLFFSTQIVHPHRYLHGPGQLSSRQSRKVATLHIKYSQTHLSLSYCGVAIAKQMLSSTYPLSYYPEYKDQIIYCFTIVEQLTPCDDGASLDIRPGLRKEVRSTNALISKFKS